MASPSFTEVRPRKRIPKANSCYGANLSPLLNWSGAPAGSKSLALIAEDVDHEAGPWVHWVLYNLPVFDARLAETVASGALPSGTLEGSNDWKRSGYRGPCPPVGRHRYFFRLFALDVVLSDLGCPTKAHLEQAMQGHILADAVLMGTYCRG